ncbi:SE1832 family protein [Jeotgalibacillus soli]|uniref:SE1832 family protein n=1 Tax=Jeotgalibacillus soli TaxID=889306 RepID=UPI0013BEA4BC
MKNYTEERINELKLEYIRTQGDLEKLESVGGDIKAAEKKLAAIEKELQELRE